MKIARVVFLSLLLSIDFSPAQNALSYEVVRNLSIAILGMAFDKDGSLISADSQIEYSVPASVILELLKNPYDVIKKVKYLPPFSLNYEERSNKIIHPDVDVNDSIETLFKKAMKRYFPKENPEDYILLTAKRVIPESRIVIVIWYFSYMQKPH